MSIPLASIDANGVIRATNPAAERVLGAVVGQRCSSAMRARCGDGPHCDDACAPNLARNHGSSREEGRARIRGATWRIVCSQLGDGVVATLLPALGEQADKLSDREREVMALVAQGLTTSQIARKLTLSPATIRTHVERARDKLGARTRAEAIARIQAG